MSGTPVSDHRIPPLPRCRHRVRPYTLARRGNDPQRDRHRRRDPRPSSKRRRSLPARRGRWPNCGQSDRWLGWLAREHVPAGGASAIPSVRDRGRTRASSGGWLARAWRRARHCDRGRDRGARRRLLGGHRLRAARAPGSLDEAAVRRALNQLARRNVRLPSSDTCSTTSPRSTSASIWPITSAKACQRRASGRWGKNLSRTS